MILELQTMIYRVNSGFTCNCLGVQIKWWKSFIFQFTDTALDFICLIVIE